MFSYVQSEIYRYKKSKGFDIFIGLIMLGLILTFLIVYTGQSGMDYKPEIDVLDTISTFLDLGLLLVPMILVSIVYKPRGPQTQIIGHGMSRVNHVIGDYLGMTVLVLKFTIIMVIVSLLLYFGGRAVGPTVIKEESVKNFLLVTARVVPATLANSAIALGLTFATGKTAIGNTVYVLLLQLLPQLLAIASGYNKIIQWIVEMYMYTPNPLFSDYAAAVKYGASSEGLLGWLPYLGIMAIIIVVFLAIGIIFYKRKEI